MAAIGGPPERLFVEGCDPERLFGPADLDVLEVNVVVALAHTLERQATPVGFPVDIPGAPREVQALVRSGLQVKQAGDVQTGLQAGGGDRPAVRRKGEVQGRACRKR